MFFYENANQRSYRSGLDVALIAIAVCVLSADVQANSIPRDSVGANSFRASIANALTYSKFSQATYENQDVNGYHRVGWVEMMRRQGVDEKRINEFKKSGFDANVYVNRQSNEAVIAYRGTDDTNLFRSDMTTNVANLQNVTTKQQVAAVFLARSALKNGYKISNTGHSLGGNLCQRAAIETNTQCVTFNSAPVGGVTDAQRRSANVFNFRFQGDLASPAMQGADYAGHIFVIEPPANLSTILATKRKHQLESFQATAGDVTDGTYRGSVQFRSATGQRSTLALSPDARLKVGDGSPVALAGAQMARLPNQRELLVPSSSPASAAPAGPSATPPLAAQPPTLGKGIVADRPLTETLRSPSVQPGGELPTRPPVAPLPPSAPNESVTSLGSSANTANASEAGGVRTEVRDIGSDRRLGAFETSTPRNPSAGAPNPAAAAQTQDPPAGGVRTGSQQPAGNRIGAFADNPAFQRLRDDFKRPEMNPRATAQTGALPKTAMQVQTGIPEAYRQELAERARQQREEQERIRRANEEARRAAREEAWRNMNEAQRRANQHVNPSNPCQLDYHRVGALPPECYDQRQPAAPPQANGGWACQQPDGGFLKYDNGTVMLIEGEQPSAYCPRWVWVDRANLGALDDDSQRFARCVAELPPKHRSDASLATMICSLKPVPLQPVRP